MLVLRAGGCGDGVNHVEVLNAVIENLDSYQEVTARRAQKKGDIGGRREALRKKASENSSIAG